MKEQKDSTSLFLKIAAVPWRALIRFLQRILSVVYPHKCVLCRKLLQQEETDLCHSCRCDTSECSTKHLRHPYLKQVISLWYYEGTVRASIHRFKFYGKRSHAKVYARLLAMKLHAQDVSFDLLTWVPVSTFRRWRRGYDQGELLAKMLGKELNLSPEKLLRKHRNNRPQSTMGSAAHRRANVLGVYRCVKPELIRGKRILLLDDVITSGATAGECARVLLTAGAKEVLCATVASASHSQKTGKTQHT